MVLRLIKTGEWPRRTANSAIHDETMPERISQILAERVRGLNNGTSDK